MSEASAYPPEPLTDHDRQTREEARLIRMRVAVGTALVASLLSSGCARGPASTEAAGEMRARAGSDCVPRASAISTGESATDLASDEGSIWVHTVKPRLTSSEHPTNEVREIDPASGRVVGEPVTVAVSIEDENDVPEDIAAGESYVWLVAPNSTANPEGLPGTLLRIDPETHRIDGRARIPKGASTVAVGAGSVWVPNEDKETILRIDPKSLRVTDEVSVGGRPVGLSFTNGAVWFSIMEGDGWIASLDPATETVDRLVYGKAVYAIDRDSLWLTKRGHDIQRFEIATRRWAPERYEVNIEPPGVLTGEGTVWFMDRFYTGPEQPGTSAPRPMEIGIWRIDPRTLEPTTSTHRFASPEGSMWGLAAFSSVWILSPETKGIIRLDGDC